jgi:hypothetical protein
VLCPRTTYRMLRVTSLAETLAIDPPTRYGEGGADGFRGGACAAVASCRPTFVAPGDGRRGSRSGRHRVFGQNSELLGSIGSTRE